MIARNNNLLETVASKLTKVASLQTEVRELKVEVSRLRSSLAAEAGRSNQVS